MTGGGVGDPIPLRDAQQEPVWLKGVGIESVPDEDDNEPPPLVEDRVGYFDIKPGVNTAALRLPEPEVNRAHFYIHVDAQPLRRNVDFTGTPRPAGPSFSLHSVCYSTCYNASDVNQCVKGGVSGS